MRTQTLVQLTDDLLASLDQRAAQTGRSRSDLIREALQRYLEDALEAEVDRQIVDGYKRIPPVEDRWAAALARESIAAEPW